MGGPPMGGPPMGPPPMGPPPTAQVVRRGTSKAVPIVVSAGLAVGVFCGLLFGLGVETTASATTSTTTTTTVAKKDDKSGFNVAPAQANPSANNPVVTKTTPAVTNTGSGSAAAETGSGSAAAGSGSGSAAPAAAGTGSGSAAPAGTGSGSAAPAGTGSGSAGPTKTEPVKTEPAAPAKGKLIVEIKPEAAAKDAKITVDGSEITGLSTEVELDKTGKKSVKVKVTSTGYRSFEQKVDVEAGDVTVKAEMSKKPTGPAIPTGPRPGGKKDGKSGKKNDLIDI